MLVAILKKWLMGSKFKKAQIRPEEYPFNFLIISKTFLVKQPAHLYQSVQYSLSLLNVDVIRVHKGVSFKVELRCNLLVNCFIASILRVR